MFLKQKSIARRPSLTFLKPSIRIARWTSVLWQDQNKLAFVLLQYTQVISTQNVSSKTWRNSYTTSWNPFWCPAGQCPWPIIILVIRRSSLTTIATFADDTALVAVHNVPLVASHILQKGINAVQNWLKKWRIKANKSKSVQVTFTMSRETCPSVFLNNYQIPQADDDQILRNASRQKAKLEEAYFQ